MNTQSRVRGIMTRSACVSVCAYVRIQITGGYRNEKSVAVGSQESCVSVSDNPAVFLTFSCERAERVISATASPCCPRPTTCSHISIATVSLSSSDVAS